MLSLRSIFSRQSHPRQRERMLRKLSMTVLVCNVPLLVNAQTKPVAPAEKVYTYVEQMPQLPGGGGTQRIWNEFQKRLRFPAIDLRQQYNGRATVYLEISPSGVVQHVKLLRFTGSAAMDSALTTAAKALPRFTPGYQKGRPVTVSITLPISCLKPQ